MRRPHLLLAAALMATTALPVAAAAAEGPKLRLATFRCDVTPPHGHPLIWVTPLRSVEDPLWAKGIVLDDAERRYVLCAVDWCALCNSSHRLQIGPACVVHLPGEPMLEFQRYAQQVQPGGFVAVAGYGDCGTGYLCTNRAFGEGGYEPTASRTGRNSEVPLKTAIRRMLPEYFTRRAVAAHVP